MATEFQLSVLLEGISEIDMNADCVVSSITLDSRRVTRGSLFLAVPGGDVDGRKFISHAVDRGAAAILYEISDNFIPPEVAVPVYPVNQLTSVMGKIADRFFDSPSTKLTVIGITGTNGKTTCTQLIAQTLDAPEKRCAVIGTLGNGFVGALDETINTTPDVLTVHALMAKYLSAGANCICIEVSSHALDQGRVNGVAFDIAVLTNFSRDHLDYHGDMESYAAAKKNLFALPGIKVAVINREDDLGKQLLSAIDESIRVVSFGLSEGDYFASSIVTSINGLQIDAVTPAGAISFSTRLFGQFNAANMLTVLAVVAEHGLSIDEIAKRFQTLIPIEGRMERFGGRDELPLVVVDYAHTPDALEKVLQALREHTTRALWCIFGCGGDRDRGKRSLMGRIAEQLADHVILTDDNPRHEDPAQITNDIQSGMQSSARVVHLRAEAIRDVISEAAEGDIVLLAGKGHEDYQQIGSKKIHFSDRETVTQILGEAA